jgi:hypothetical protein
MVSRRRADINDLLDHQLRRFDAAVFVDVQPVRQLDDAAVGVTCLVEGNGIQGRPAGCRLDPHLEVVLADDPLVDNFEIAEEQGLRKSGTPRTCISQPPCERE